MQNEQIKRPQGSLEGDILATSHFVPLIQRLGSMNMVEDGGGVVARHLSAR